MKDKTEITLEELADLPEGLRLLIDTRDEISMAYGTIPGAVHIPDLSEQAEAGTLPKDRLLVLFCMHGTQSLPLAEKLQESGYQACSLKNGYGAWLLKNLTPADRSAEIENALRRVRRFHEKLMTPFTRAIKEYRLLQPGDRVAVCISGGKDSMLMAKLFQEIQRHRQCNFELTFLVMDPGYNKENRELIESNAKTLGIPVTIFESDIFDAVDNIEKSPCYICARMRRGYLYSKAKSLGCNKIALGHHYDDVIETILMGMLHGAQIQTMMPKLHSTNFEGMELIRPMYLIRESDICAWRDYNDLYFLQCACHFTDTCTTCHEDGTTSSKRLETKKLIAELKKNNPFIESNIFKSVENVNLDTVIAYKKNGERHHFLDEY